jgi:hypothetical protein
MGVLKIAPLITGLDVGAMLIRKMEEMEFICYYGQDLL